MVLAAVAQEHLLVIGPPGTGKSAEGCLLIDIKLPHAQQPAATVHDAHLLAWGAAAAYSTLISAPVRCIH